MMGVLGHTLDVCSRDIFYDSWNSINLLTWKRCRTVAEQPICRQIFEIDTLLIRKRGEIAAEHLQNTCSATEIEGIEIEMKR